MKENNRRLQELYRKGSADVEKLYNEKLGPHLHFKDVDNWALKELEVAEDNPHRIRAVNRLSLNTHIAENSYVHKNIHLEFIKKHRVYDFQEYVIMVDANYELVEDPGKCVYVTSIPVFMAEKQVAEELKVRNSLPPLPVPSFASNRFGIELSDDQVTAIQQCFSQGVSVITGGPGTGKTTVLRVLKLLADEMNVSTVFTSFTGKAVRRLEEVIEGRASTIHRLLGYNGTDFAHNRRDRLGGIDILVIDEASMLGLFLFRSLLYGISQKTRIVIVGDPNQLPSIDTGNVLSDILKSNVFTTTRFKEPFRQAEKSCIIRNCYKVLHGEHDLVFPVKEGEGFVVKDNGRATIPDMFFKECTGDQIQKEVVNAFEYYANNGADNYLEEIQILSANKDGVSGTRSLNLALRYALTRKVNSPEDLEDGDKVIFTRNNYEARYMNGDMGIVKGSSVKLFSGVSVQVSNVKKSWWELGYAITVHKSQGSEFNYIILPITEAQSFMMTRALLYTAISRARRGVMLVGNWKALHMFIANDRKMHRRTNLAASLRI